MKKFRWVEAKWPHPIADISKILLSNQYSDINGRGFLLSASSSKKITGKFIEKTRAKTTTIDPFGNESEIIETKYYVVKFGIDHNSGLIELSDPPRSLRKFASELHGLIGLGLELSDLTVNPLTWLEHIEQSLSPVSIINISASGIRVPENGLAKITVSGKKDIRKEFNNLVTDKHHTIDAIKFAGEINNCQLNIELKKTGIANITGHIYDGLIEEVKSCLNKAKTY